MINVKEMNNEELQQHLDGLRNRVPQRAKKKAKKKTTTKSRQMTLGDLDALIAREKEKNESTD